MFDANRVFPGVTHIRDNMGVCFTLIEGTEKAMLVDAGYGLEDVRGFTETLTKKPVTLLLTHGHHDHVLGARWFDRAVLDEEDRAEYTLRIGREQRERVQEQAKGQGLCPPADFLNAVMPETVSPAYKERIAGFDARTEDLGGLNVQIIHVPGHTAGSLVCFIPEYGLLLTGDDWNPCTWMWFPCSLGADRWQANMLRLLEGLEASTGVQKILCSHQPMIREGTELKAYLQWITPKVLASAERSPLSSEINVRRAFREDRGWELFFDADKIGSPE